MNLNDYNNEYQMFNDQTAEIIDMYGVPVTYIKSKNVNFDSIFGEFSHKKLVQDGVFKDIMVLPENPEAYDVGVDYGNLFTKFGFMHGEVFHCYISSYSVDAMGFENFRVDAMGDLIMVPSGKTFEITYISHEPVGANNKYAYDLKKNVYMIKCKVWFYNGDEKEDGKTVVDENGIESIEDSLNKFDFSKMDIVFNVDSNNDDIPVEEKVVPVRKSEQETEAKAIKIKKPTVFGDYD